MDLDALVVSPVLDSPLLSIEGGRTLLAADLHIGIERELMEGGVRVPRQWPIMASIISRGLCSTGARRLVLLGDVKHRIPHASFSEEQDVPLFFKKMLEEAEVEVVPGNHDGWLRRLAPPGVVVHDAHGAAIDGVGLMHGHCWPSEDVAGCRVLVMGHIHPSIALHDEIGTRTIMPCWLRARLKSENVDGSEVIVMPAMSRLRRGTPVNGGRGIGPLFRSGRLDLPGAGVYLLDGTFLGSAGGIP